MEDLKKYSTEELEALFYALDINDLFNRVFNELKRRHEHKRILAGLKL
jgi:hypothetical protein